MKSTEKSLFNCIVKIHKDISLFVDFLRKNHPKLQYRNDLSMFSTDLEQWPGSPVGLSWEINLDDRDEYFFLELIQDSRWQLNAEHSRIRQESITQFFAYEFEESLELIGMADELTEKFKQCCLSVIEGNYP